MMSDRINSVTVVLNREIREDDCEPLLIAIRMIKGVLRVTPNIADSSEYMAIERAKEDLRHKLWGVIDDN